MKEITFIDDRRKRYLVESNPVAPNFKCQIKLHKRERPVRPIVSFINAPAYKLSKEVSRILKDKYEFDVKYNVENNVKLIEMLEGININENMKLVSLDIKDMFTNNIAVDKALKLVEDNRMGNYEYKKQLVKVIKECVQQNYFRFNDRVYIQEEGLPMGSSLSPILADIYIYIYI